jgi:hypothetical protein
MNYSNKKIKEKLGIEFISVKDAIDNAVEFEIYSKSI